MRQKIIRRGVIKKWTLFAAVAVAACIGVGAALAQVGSTQDITAILEQLGLTGTGGTGTDTTDPTTPPTTSQPGGGGSGGREPTVIENQFNTTSGGALQARRPGVWIQNAQAVQAGDTDFFTGDVDTSDGFIKTTVDTILLNIIETFTNLLNGFNLLSGLQTALPGIGGTGDGTTTGEPGTIPNSTTSGAGTSTPIQ